MQRSDFKIDDYKQLMPYGRFGQAVHRANKAQISAILAAYHSGRPLLVTGVPGVGKSQLAHYVAEVMQWHLETVSISAYTDAQALLYEVDHLARMTTAQILANSATVDHPQDLLGNTSLELQNFIIPGPLWWAIDPQGAQQACEDAKQSWRCRPRDADRAEKGVVLLIDEIDKASMDLSNSLLEALAYYSFGVEQTGQTIKAKSGHKPLVIVTSNSDRPLPDAFVRRCVCLPINQPDKSDIKAIALAHSSEPKSASAAIKKRHKELVDDVVDAIVDAGNGPDYRPSVAEVLDVLRALAAFEPEQRPEEFKNIIEFFATKANQ